MMGQQQDGQAVVHIESPDDLENKHTSAPSLASNEDAALLGQHTPPCKELPWAAQITVRGIILGAGLGAVFCIVVHKLMLTVGLFPTFNTAAGLLSYIALQAWAFVERKMNLPTKPLQPQENTVVQTFIIACCNIAFSGGFGLHLAGLDEITWKNIGDTYPGNLKEDTYAPTPGRTIPYLLCVSIIGVFMVVFLRKLFIIDYELPFPSGAATGTLINGFYTVLGQETAKRQMRSLGVWFAVAFLWGLFKWFFSGTHCDICQSPVVCGGFQNFPTFGLAAYQWQWHFDFALNLIGTGMICSHNVDWSIMFGSVLSWGILWPTINKKAGIWFDAKYKGTDMRGLYGYKVFITLSIFLGDGLYNIVKVLWLSGHHMLRRQAHLRQLGQLDQAAAYQHRHENDSFAGHANDAPDLRRDAGIGEGSADGFKETLHEKKRRTQVFLTDNIPWWLSIVGYSTLAVLGTIVIPFIYPRVSWYIVLTAYILAPIFAVPNAYGDGLTDWDMASMYGKLGILVFAAWGGANGGVTAGLVSCGVLLVATSTAAHLMQDFRTGYLTHTSPRAMFVSQVLGAVMGVFLAPLTFMLFWNTGQVGDQSGQYKNPLAQVYRSMAIIGSQGLDTAMPRYCGWFVLAFFFGAIGLNAVRDCAAPSLRRWLPIPMAVGIPFYLGSYLAIDMCIGSLVNLMWTWADPVGQEALSMSVAAGLLVGDGVWTVPASILALANIQPPICMAFASKQ